MLTISETWQRTYPGALQGLLVIRRVRNPDRHAALDDRKAALEAALRAQFAGYDRAALNTWPPLQPYARYYGRFKKTYHVQLQLESVVWKGKSIPNVAALVEAMFMAELKNQLLTAGHDSDALRPPLRLDIAAGGELYQLLNGREEALKPGDIFMADAVGVISSILYGPDARTRITPETRRALFTVYAPPGVEPATVRQHLDDIGAHARLIAPEAEVEFQHVYGAA